MQTHPVCNIMHIAGFVARFAGKQDVIKMHVGLPPNETFPLRWLSAGTSEKPSHATTTQTPNCSSENGRSGSPVGSGGAVVEVTEQSKVSMGLAHRLVASFLPTMSVCVLCNT